MHARILAGFFSSILFLAAIITAVVVSLRTFNREGDRRQSALITNTSVTFEELEEISVASIISKSARESKVIVLFHINSIDVTGLSLKMTITPVPLGRFFKAPKLENASVKNMTLSIGGKIFKIKAKEDISPIETTLNIDGDVNRYPFDQYWKMISPTLYDSDDEEIPMGVIVTGGLQGLRMNVISNVGDDGDVDLLFEITRSRLTLAFSLFIIMMMWVVSLLLLSLAIVSWIKDVTITGPLLAVPVGCLFALPTIRNSQPMVPPVGTLGDIIGFFWNMTFAVVAVIILFVVFMFKAIRANNKSDSNKEFV